MEIKCRGTEKCLTTPSSPPTFAINSSMISPCCTTSGYVTWEHSSFSVIRSRHLSVLPKVHCEQTLNPSLAGSGPAAALCSNTQMCEAGRMKKKKKHLSGTNSLWPIAFSHFAASRCITVGLHLNKDFCMYLYYLDILYTSLAINGWLEDLW